MFQSTTQAAADGPRRPARPDHLAVTFEPHLTGGITQQVPAVRIREQRTQMQRSDALLHVDVHHHGGAMPVRAPRRLGVPPRIDQTHKRLTRGGQRRPLIGSLRTLVVITFPLGEQRIPMRRQRRIELRGLQSRKRDPVARALLVAGLGDRGLWFRPRLGFGSRFELDRGAQLADCGDRGQLRIMLIGSLGGLPGDDPDLIQRQPALPHALGAARKLLQSVCHRGDRARGRRGQRQLPGHHRRQRPRTGQAPQPVAVDFGDDLHDAPINRVALTGQLRQLTEQHLNTIFRPHRDGVRRRGHDPIIAAGSDKFASV